MTINGDGLPTSEQVGGYKTKEELDRQWKETVDLQIGLLEYLTSEMNGIEGITCKLSKDEEKPLNSLVKIECIYTPHYDWIVGVVNNGTPILFRQKDGSRQNLIGFDFSNPRVHKRVKKRILKEIRVLLDEYFPRPNDWCCGAWDLRRYIQEFMYSFNEPD